MFERATSYPCAVTSADEQGISEGLRWCRTHGQSGDSLTLWVPLKSSLRANDRIRRISEQRDVDIVTGRGVSYLREPGPVLAAWPRMEDIGEIQRSAPDIRALCVIAWNEDKIRPWVDAVRPEILGDRRPWIRDVEGADLTPELDAVIVEAMKDLTATINHNNTIAAGYEKDDVVGVLLALYSAGYRLNGEAQQGWALAHGWAGKNPQRLAEYVRDINAGKRPRVTRTIRADYIRALEQQVAVEQREQSEHPPRE